MEYTKTCLECGQINPLAAKQCSNCGADLQVDTTISISSDALQLQRPEVNIDADLDQDTLYFYVAGVKQSDALTHRGKSTAVLGRRSDDTAGYEGLIDLNKFQGYTLGVSRRHAQINYTDAGYTIEDLNSSNGTWLNGNKLEPNQPHALRRGDHIQLGELMMFVYYFHPSS